MYGAGCIGEEFVGEVISIDQACTLEEPTHKVCILEWDFNIYPRHYFVMIWASPPCTEYSKARATAKTQRDLIGADRLVLQVLTL